jgi:hypothetical protein
MQVGVVDHGGHKLRWGPTLAALAASTGAVGSTSRHYRTRSAATLTHKRQSASTAGCPARTLNGPGIRTLYRSPTISRCLVWLKAGRRSSSRHHRRPETQLLERGRSGLPVRELRVALRSRPYLAEQPLRRRATEVGRRQQAPAPSRVRHAVHARARRLAARRVLHGDGWRTQPAAQGHFRCKPSTSSSTWSTWSTRASG